MSARPTSRADVLASLAGTLVVSCQAHGDNPLVGPSTMATMARAAVLGGAGGIRAEGAADVEAIVAAVPVPVIGLVKAPARGPDEVFITPTYADAESVAQAGAAVIALDGTPRPRRGGAALSEIVDRIHRELGLAVMADVDSLNSGRFAADAGCDLVGTTLSGYTAATNCTPGASSAPDGPDLQLVARLSQALEVPVVAEGRIWTREDALVAFAAGASTVVVGTAVTNPMLITRRFIAAVSSRTTPTP